VRRTAAGTPPGPHGPATTTHAGPRTGVRLIPHGRQPHVRSVSEPAPRATAGASSGPASRPAPPTPAANEPGEGTDWKAEARKWESRAKENHDAATRLRELEDAQKTEQQKLAEQLQEAQTNGATTQAELAQLRAALAKAPAGMNPADVLAWSGRLRGGTLEELEKDAEELFRQFAPPPPASRPGQRPTEALRTVPLETNGTAERTDMNEWMRSQAQPNR
jgi:hypothetical protein